MTSKSKATLAPALDKPRTFAIVEQGGAVSRRGVTEGQCGLYASRELSTLLIQDIYVDCASCRPRRAAFRDADHLRSVIRADDFWCNSCQATGWILAPWPVTEAAATEAVRSFMHAKECRSVIAAPKFRLERSDSWSPDVLAAAEAYENAVNEAAQADDAERLEAAVKAMGKTKAAFGRALLARVRIRKAT